MTIQDLKQTITALNEQDFFDLFGWVCGDEYDRRKAAPAVEKVQADLVTELQDAGKLEKPEVATEEQAKTDATSVPEWQDPGVDHALMYHYGDVVRHNGKLVRSIHKGLNHWTPGTLAFDGRIWEVIGDANETQPETSENEETAERPEAPAFKAPTGGHDAYGVGDRVTYQGAVWESTIPNNVWSPSDYPQGWKKL